MKIKITTLLFLVFSSSLFSTTTKRDSLLKLINTSNKNDTIKLINIKALTYYYFLEEGNIDEALKTSESLIFTAEKSNSKLWLGKSYSINAYIKSNYTADFKGAIKSYFSAIKYFEEINQLDQLLTTYINLGVAFYQYNEYENANTYLKKAEKIALKLKSGADLATIYFNLGGTNLSLNKDSLALNYFEKAKNFYKTIGDELGLATVDFNMANVILKNEKNVSEENRWKAIKVYKKTNDVFKKFNIVNNQLICEINIGTQLTKLGEVTEGLEFLNDAENLAIQNGTYRNLLDIYDGQAINATQRGDLPAGIKYLKLYIAANDSLFKENKLKAISEIQTKYETEKKEKENQLLTLENKNKSQIIYFALGGCTLLFGLVFFIYRGYRNKQKANTLLAEKNSIISHQKEIVEEQHQEITDSIKYAQRIQGAILPPRNMWQQILPNSFVLYMPKDVLSGDFYWIEETKDYIYVAAADCTGHGVPGALISIVNFNLLNKAVLEQNLVTPSEILDAVNSWLTVSLHQTYRESAVRDGMDVSLIAIHKHSNEILFAGANNPIYIVSKGELKQIKGDKFPVGAFIEDQIQKFTTKSFKVNKGDTIYLFSDGFADQFGGDNGKKYKYAPFQQKLIAISEQDLTEQRQVMKQEFLKWKGKHEQVDDVLLIGIKIS